MRVTRVDGAEMAETERRAVLTAIAEGLTNPSRASSSREENHLDLQGVFLSGGGVLVNTPSERDQTLVLSLLRSMPSDTYSLTTRAHPARRFRIGLPGYLVDMGGARATEILMSQNLELPAGSLTPISLFRGRGERPHPVLFVEVSDEGVARLEAMDFTIRTLTGSVVVRPANHQ